jgi:hypothetical protein
MDKMTNGYATIPKGQEAEAKADIKRVMRERMKEEFGVDSKVKVTIEPFEHEVYTHRYKARMKA